MCITILTVISYIISPFCSAAQTVNFTISSPEEINAEEEITLRIDVTGYNSSSTYDVKAYINDDVLASSELYDFTTSKWRSPQNYLIAAFPGHTEFKVKSHFIGETNVCVRLRKTSQSSYAEVCNKITVNAAQPPPEDGNNSGESNSSSQETENSPPDTEDSSSESTRDSQPSNSSSQSNISTLKSTTSSTSVSAIQLNSEKIVLAPKKSSSASENIFVTKSEKTRLIIVYGFTLLCVVTIILLVLRLL